MKTDLTRISSESHETLGETPTSQSSFTDDDSTLHHVEATPLKKLLGDGAISEKEEAAYHKTFTPKLKSALQEACKVKTLSDRKQIFSSIKTQLNLVATETNEGKTAQAHILPALEDRLIDWNRDQHYQASRALLEPNFEYPEHLESEHPFGYQGELSNVQYLIAGEPPANFALTAANQFLVTTYPKLGKHTHWDLKPTGQITRHSGWISTSKVPLVATRTFGMMDGNRCRVGSLELDLSSLGNLDPDQRMACLKYLEEPDPTNLPKGAQQLLDHFEQQCDSLLEKMHEELMRFDESVNSEPSQRCVD